MLHPDLLKLRDSVRSSLPAYKTAEAQVWGVNLQLADWRKVLEALQWHDDMFDIGVDALKRKRDVPAPPALPGQFNY